MVVGVVGLCCTLVSARAGRRLSVKASRTPTTPLSPGGFYRASHHYISPRWGSPALRRHPRWQPPSLLLVHLLRESHTYLTLSYPRPLPQHSTNPLASTRCLTTRRSGLLRAVPLHVTHPRTQEAALTTVFLTHLAMRPTTAPLSTPLTLLLQRSSASHSKLSLAYWTTSRTIPSMAARCARSMSRSPPPCSRSGIHHST